MFCIKCGNKLNDGEAFCGKCGAHQMILDGTSQANDEKNRNNTDNDVKKKGYIVIKGLTIFASVILVVGLLLWIQIATVRMSTSGKEIDNLINSIEIGNIDIGEFVEENNISLSEYIYKKLDEDAKDKYHLSANVIRELLSDEDIKEFYSDNITKVIEYVVNDKKMTVTVDEIVDLIKLKSNKIERLTGYELVESDYEGIRSSLNDNIGDTISTDLIPDDIKSTINTVRPIISTITLVGMMLLFIIYMVIVVYVYRPVIDGLKWATIPLVVVGTITIIEGVIISLFLTSILKTSAKLPTELSDVISSIITNKIMFLGCLFLIIGIVPMLVIFVIKKYKKGEK